MVQVMFTCNKEYAFSDTISGVVQLRILDLPTGIIVLLE